MKATTLLRIVIIGTLLIVVAAAHYFVAEESGPYVWAGWLSHGDRTLQAIYCYIICLALSGPVILPAQSKLANAASTTFSEELKRELEKKGSTPDRPTP